MPETILSDCGKAFTAKIVKEVEEIFGIKHSLTSGYHPQTNELVEKHNGTIANMIHHYATENGSDWGKSVQPLTFAYNASIHETMKHTPCFLMFGWNPVQPTDVGLNLERLSKRSTAEEREAVRKWVVDMQKKCNNANKKLYDLRHRTPSIKVGDLVMVKDFSVNKYRTSKLLHKYLGPYVVARLISPVLVELSGFENGKPVNVARLKPYNQRQGQVCSTSIPRSKV